MISNQPYSKLNRTEKLLLPLYLVQANNIDWIHVSISI